LTSLERKQVQEGFLRESASSSRGIAQRADEIMRLTGADGRGANTRTSLPVEDLFPRREGDNGRRSFKRGMMSLTVAFHQRAVQDILHSETRAIIRAYANTLSGETRKMMLAVLERGTISKNGGIEYSRGEISEETGIDIHRDDNPYANLYRAARKATKIVRDIRQAAETIGAEKQTAAILDLFAGAGESGLAYDDIVKVLIQLVDPSDVTAEFYVQVIKKIKDEKDIGARYVLHEGGESELLEAMTRAKTRFAHPPELKD